MLPDELVQAITTVLERGPVDRTSGIEVVAAIYTNGTIDSLASGTAITPVVVARIWEINRRLWSRVVSLLTDPEWIALQDRAEQACDMFARQMYRDAPDDKDGDAMTRFFDVTGNLFNTVRERDPDFVRLFGKTRYCNNSLFIDATATLTDGVWESKGSPDGRTFTL